jgi:hypothetical protein
MADARNWSPTFFDIYAFSYKETSLPRMTINGHSDKKRCKKVVVDCKERERESQ